MVRTALSSRMGRRIAAALTLCSALPLAAFALASGRLELSTPHALLAAALLATLCVSAAALHLARRYVPDLAAARAAIAAMQERRLTVLRGRGGDEPRALLEALATCAAGIEAQLRALETLAEIDRMLLGSVALEHVLDAVLARVQALTHGQCVSITLRDGDAPGRGRVYVAAALDDLPVSRVALDGDMLATLATAPQGLTIARCEEERHSFLKPLKGAGADVFWVWPVIVSGRVEAILATGFTEAPDAGPRFSRFGGELAARLAVALSRSAREERLYRQAHYDPLTGLPNRLLFRDRLCQEVATRAAGPSRGALLYIDLDQFKRVNDGFGHGVGDQLLTVVAQRLRACIKEGDLVARLGGDEFTIVLQEVSDAAAARAVAERVAETLRLPIRIGPSEHRISASIGVALFPDDGTGIEDLVRHADTAMYRAKDLGGSRIMLEDRGAVSAPSAVSAVSAGATSLGGAGLPRTLRRRQFSLFYQPQFAVADGALAGIEALLRWHAPRDGARHSEEFVPAAEESGLIVDIGGWVLDAACSQLAAWRDLGSALPRLAVSVCLQQLQDAEFPRAVRRALDKHALPSELLELELAPSVLGDEGAAASLARLEQLGVRLALDGCGAGDSSMGDLRHHPIAVVRLDGALIGRIPHDSEAVELVATAIKTAHALGKRVVAQGVESIEQLDFLREHRCDLAQGFYLARPLSAAGITELLDARSASPSDDAAREAG